MWRSSFPQRWRRALGLVGGLALGAIAHAQIVLIGNGDWSNPLVWLLNGIPGGADTAQIGSFGITVSDTRSVGALTLSGGTIGGGGTLTIASTGSTWTSGAMVGTGSTVIASGASLTLSGTGAKTVSRADNNGSGGRTFDNSGTVTITGTGALLGGDGAAFFNRTGAVFDLQANTSLGYNGSGNLASFSNAGTFRKSVSAGTATVGSMSFANTGTVDATAGTLLFTTDVTSTGGIFSASSGATITLSGGQSFTNTQFNGSGRIEFTAGTTTLNGAISAQNLFFTAGTLLGTATISGSALEWSGGAWSGTGITTLNVPVSLTGSANKSYNRGDNNGSGGRSIVNNSTLTWTGAGSLLGGDGGSFTNAASGSVLIQNDATLGYNSSGDAPSFNNQGLLRKTVATGTTTVSSTHFTHSGTIDIQSGALVFNSDVTSNGGAFGTSGTGTITFAGGQAFNNNTSFTGPAGAINITSGTTTFAGNLTSQNLTFTTGTLLGTATVSGSALAWTGGAWSGTGILTLNVPLAISGAATKTYNRGDNNGSGGRTIVNNSTVTWTGTGALVGGDGATFTNSASALFLVQNDSTLGYNSSGNAATFNNAGTFRKNTTSGVTTVTDNTFNNTGTVDVQTGTLTFNTGVTGTGAFNVAPTANILFTAGQTFGNGASFTGSGGTIKITGGTTSVSGSLTSQLLDFAGGALLGSADLAGDLTWSGGAWIGTGLLQHTTGTLKLSGAADKTIARADNNGSGGRILRSAGNVVWTGTGKLLGGDGAGLDLLSGSVFEIQNASTYKYNSSGDLPFLTNAGTVRKAAASGTTIFDGVVFNNLNRLELLGGALSLVNGGGLANSGLVQIQAGTLSSAASGATSTGGTFDVWSGAQLGFSGGTNTFSGVTFTGHGTTELGGGTMIFSGTNSAISGGNFLFSSGALGGAGQLTVENGGTLEWTGGALFGTGKLKIAATGTLNLTGSTTRTFSRADNNGSGGHIIENFGLVSWMDSGALRGGDGAAFLNQAGATFLIGGNALFGYNSSGDGPTFTNAGTVRKTGGGELTDFAVSFTNNGVVEVFSGSIRFSGGGSGNGRFHADASTIEFTSNFTLNDGATFTGGGNLLSSGVLNIPGGASAHVASVTATPGALTLASGALAGAGTLAVESNGQLNWTGTPLVGTGALVVNSGGALLIEGAVNHDFSRADNNGSGGRRIDNYGNTLWNDGALRGGDGAVFTNRSGGLFVATGDGALTYNGSGDLPTFDNRGHFQKSGGTGTTTVSATNFVSTGLVEVQTGTLRFDTGVTSNGGSFSASSGATLVFAGGQTFNAGSNIFGPGLVQAIAGATTLNGALTFNTFELGGGSLYGTAVLNNSFFLWSGGDLRGPSTLTIAANSVLNIGGTGNHDFWRADNNGSGGRVIEVGAHGRILWSNAADLRGGDGGAIIVRSGGFFEVQNNRALTHNGSGNLPSFTNEGAFMKTSGGGKTTIAVPFTNASTGSIGVYSGAVEFTSSFTNTNGSVFLDQGAALSVPGALNIGTGSLSGWGTVSAPSGTTVGGVFFPERITINGDLTLLGSAFSAFDLGGATQGITTGTGYGFVQVNGTATLGGTLGLHFANNFQSTIANGASLTLLSATAPLTGAFANVASGQRLTSLDGLGSFMVNYSGNDLVLSNFVAVPEPSTWVLMLSGLGAMAFLRRRRRN